MWLTHAEADMLLRAGYDMRREAWPGDWFVRYVPPTTVIPGYEAGRFEPTQLDLTATDWRRA